MLQLVIADAELEQVPREIASHRAVVWHARRRGRRPTEILLNSSLHYPAMRSLPDADRRGRPDITQMCLLLALDSPLNREGLLKTYVHTRHDKLINVDASARLPKMSNRFEGLIEHLFIKGAAPPEKPLLSLEDASLKVLLERLKPKRTITFSDKGDKKSWKGVFSGVPKDDDVCVIVGGFPHGDFISDVAGLSDDIVCIDPDLLCAPTVVSRAIYAYEEAFGVQDIRLGR